MAKIDDSVKKKVPELRFKGFTDDWEERKVGNFLSESKIKGSDGSVSKKLTVKLWRKGIVPKEEIYKGSSATQYYIRLAGQFMYGKLDFLNQAFGILPKELDGYESTLDSPAFDFKDGINPNFFLEYVCQENFYKYQGNIANGSRKAKRIHADTFFDMPITIPSFEEQEKIGNFFKELDDAIALHQRKLDLLKEQKKGYLQKMFPKNGAKVPELRFAGFANDWEERKLEDISEIIDGDRGKNYPSGDDFKNNGHTLFLSAANVTKQGFVFKETQYITKLKSESLGSGKVILNDIILTSRGSIGHIGFYDKKTHEYIPQARINSGMLILRTDKLNSPSFIAQFLKSPWGIKQIKLISFGSAQPQLTKKDIKNFKIILPKMEEQEKIGSFFQKLDDTIALHQRKLDLLKEQKKGFLQKMFV